MDPSSRIFVAGHRGLVGSALFRCLSGRGFGNLLTAGREEVDLTRQEAVDRFFETNRPEYVFLAAARVGGIWANDRFPADFIRDNLLIETLVLDAAHRFGAKKLLFLGSSCIYPRLAPQPMTEDCLLTGPLEPTNQWYAVAKIAGIKMGQALRRQHGFSAISVMPTNLYGPGDNFDLMESHVLPAMIRKLHLARMATAGDWEGVLADRARFGGIPPDFRASLGALALAAGHEAPDGYAPPPDTRPAVVLWGTGSPRREFLHVDDLADACVFLMEQYDREDIVNVGVGEDVSIRDLADRVRAASGFSGEIAWDREKPDGTPRKLLDVGRLKALGWRPSIGLAEGISRTSAWYRDQVESRRGEP